MGIVRMILAAAVVVFQGHAALAADLRGSEIRTLIEGKTVHLRIAPGLQLPLRYRPGGVVSGDISGISMASMFAPKEDGRWWIDENRLCQKWPGWYQGRTFCFTIRSTGKNRIDWLRDDGASGSAIIAD